MSSKKGMQTPKFCNAKKNQSKLFLDKISKKKKKKKIGSKLNKRKVSAKKVSPKYKITCREKISQTFFDDNLSTKYKKKKTTTTTTTKQKKKKKKKKKQSQNSCILDC